MSPDGTANADSAPRGGWLEVVVTRGTCFLAVFWSGASLMSLEMTGLRLVQPEFGSTITVTGSIISVFLGGLALGAYVGGKWADHRPALWKLALVLAGAGALALTLPLYADIILEWTFPDEAGYEAVADTGELQVFVPTDLKWPTLATGLLLFLAPALLLGMVTPYYAKLLIHRLGRLGSGVGKISALSTGGAIVGTLGTSFYLVTWLGTRWLLAINGLVLAGLALLLILAELLTRRRVPPGETVDSPR